MADILIELAAEDNASREIRQVSEATDDLSDNLDRSTVSLESLTGGVANTVAGLGALTAGVGGLVAGVSGLITGYADAVGSLSRLSAQTGIDPLGIQLIEDIATVVGIERDDIIGALEELNIRLGEESEDALEAIQTLGIEIGDLETLDPAGQLYAISQALGELEDVQLRASLADRIFGGDAFRIAPLFGLTADELDRIAEVSGDIAIDVTDSDVAAVRDYRLQWLELTGTWDRILVQIGRLALPAVSNLLEGVEETFDTPFGEALVGEGEIFTAAGQAIGELTGAFSGAIGSIVDLAGGAPSFEERQAFNNANRDTPSSFDEFIGETTLDDVIAFEALVSGRAPQITTSPFNTRALTESSLGAVNNQRATSPFNASAITSASEILGGSFNEPIGEFIGAPSPEDVVAFDDLVEEGRMIVEKGALAIGEIFTSTLGGAMQAIQTQWDREGLTLPTIYLPDVSAWEIVEQGIEYGIQTGQFDNIIRGRSSIGSGGPGAVTG